jgi:CBS domain-containing protein
VDGAVKRIDVQVRLGIRQVRLLGQAGDSKETSTIFCPRLRRSENLARCLACSRLVRKAEDSIECVVEREERHADAAGAPRLGGEVCVGEVAGCSTLCVLANVAPAVLARSMQDHGAAFAVVVEVRGRPVGLVDREAAVLGSQSVSVRDLARPIVSVREGSPLAFAVQRMVHERVRALPVIDHEGAIVALLSDIDALRWVARCHSAIPGRLPQRSSTQDTTATPWRRNLKEFPMTPSEIRSELLSQHSKIRTMLEATCLATQVDRAGDPRAHLLRLADALRAHNLREEVLLKDLVLGADAWGAARVAIMIEEHIQEHTRLCQALDQAPYTPVEPIVSGILAAIEEIRAHMDREEAAFLNESVLCDDIIVVNQADG